MFLQVPFSIDLEVEVFPDILVEDVSVWICVLIYFLDVRPLDFDIRVEKQNRNDLLFSGCPHNLYYEYSEGVTADL